MTRWRIPFPGLEDRKVFFTTPRGNLGAACRRSREIESEAEAGCIDECIGLEQTGADLHCELRATATTVEVPSDSKEGASSHRCIGGGADWST